MSPEILRLIWGATLDTLWMVGVSATLATLLGLPLGIFLATSGRGELFAAPIANRAVGFLVNDSGVAIPAVGATLAVPLIVSVSVSYLLDEARSVAQTRSARRRR